MIIDKRFYYSHVYIPLFVFIVLISIIEATHFDLTLADWIFNLEGGAWAQRRSFFFSDIIHTGGSSFFKLFDALLIVVWLMSFWCTKLSPYRKALLYISIVVPISIALVTNVGKLLTHIDCPWDLIRYGGDKLYLGLFKLSEADQSSGKCFPAGHASIGYTLLAFYFFFTETAPRFKYYGLGFGMIVGLLFGLSQQIRGAHFISHDLWTMTICWFLSLLWYLILFKPHSSPFNKTLIKKL